MSTHYDFNESNWMDEIRLHYSHNTDVEFDVVSHADESLFRDEDIELVLDVFVGDVKTTFITTLDEDGELTIFEMPTTVFKSKWSEKVWAKFRADFNDTVCPKCGKRMAHSVAGKSLGDIQVNQFFCEGCGNGWVGHPNGEYIRDGVLKSSWEIW